MGEKSASSADSRELLRAEVRPDAVEHVPSPAPAHVLSTPIPDATDGDSAIPLPVEKAYFEQIIENAPEAVSIVDEAHRIIRINREFTRLFGFHRRRGHREIPGPADCSSRPLRRDGVGRAERHDRRNLSLETRRQRKDGSLVEVLLSTAPVMLNGKRIGGYASYRDISDQKRAEELNAALYAIAARSQTAEDLQQFYASIHNIVGQMMYARNFYIAIYDPQSQLLSFPYFVDEIDPPPIPNAWAAASPNTFCAPASPCSPRRQVFDDLVQRGEVELIGAPSLDWLGVPLKSGNNSIGALVVQSYTRIFVSASATGRS